MEWIIWVIVSIALATWQRKRGYEKGYSDMLQEHNEYMKRELEFYAQLRGELKENHEKVLEIKETLNTVWQN